MWNFSRFQLAGSALLALAVLAGAPALAQPGPSGTLPSDPNGTFGAPRPARFIMGTKFGGGGALWDEPDNTVLGQDENGDWDLPIFDETRGGYTMSAGMFVQGIFFEHLGIEVGLHFVKHTLLEEIDWEFTETTTGNGGVIIEQNTFRAESKQELSWTAVHVPILIQAVVPTGTTRISLGVGPELAFHSWSRMKFDVTETDSPDGFLPGRRNALKNFFTVPEDSVYLTVNFGIQINAGDFIIPIDIHWSYNFSQETDYSDRVEVDDNEIPRTCTVTDQESCRRHPTKLGLHTRDTMYGGIRLGIAYQF